MIEKLARMFSTTTPTLDSLDLTATCGGRPAPTHYETVPLNDMTKRSSYRHYRFGRRKVV